MSTHLESAVSLLVILVYYGSFPGCTMAVLKIEECETKNGNYSWFVVIVVQLHAFPLIPFIHLNVDFDKIVNVEHIVWPAATQKHEV